MSVNQQPFLPSTFLVYVATLSQSGTADPVATVLANTLGNIIWTRSGAGSYVGTLMDAFPAGKLFTNPNSAPGCYDSVASASAILARIDNDSIALNYGASDGLLSNFMIEIKVYR